MGYNEHTNEQGRTVQRTTNLSPSAGTTAVSEAHIILGRYRVLETNTDGGFGSVSVCWDARLQRRVAIKQMPLLLEDESPQQVSTIEEALAEARTSSMLAHPNIVTMFDFEVDEQYSYLVMEYVDGLNLADLLARVEDGVLSFDECAHVVDSVASALAFAHENGVLHLDIKPANILIDRSGVVKLGDFGMATLASAAGYGGARGGTIGYMPPEQIEGEMVDERSDIFSLAVVVWQALTGSCPYAANDASQSLALIRRGPSPMLSRVEPDLAGTVENTLLRALDPSPTARMASVEAFARDLVNALGDTQEGADSLSDLLRQTEESDEPSPLEDWNRINVPLAVQFPWLGEACTRLLAAGTAAWVAFRSVPYIFPNSTMTLAFATAGVALACAVWPPLAGAMGFVALAGAILAQPATLAFPLALAVGVVGALWWAFVGRRFALSGPSVLLPTCIQQPVAGVGLAGFGLTPVPAFATGTLGYFLCLAFTHAVQENFFANSLLRSLRTAMTEPRTWILAAGCGVGALVCSLLSQKGKLSLRIVGQILAVLLLGLSYVACAYMEKGSIAKTVDITALVVAVFLGATLCIASAFVGESANNRKGDDRA